MSRCGPWAGLRSTSTPMVLPGTSRLRSGGSSVMRHSGKSPALQGREASSMRHARRTLMRGIHGAQASMTHARGALMRHDRYYYLAPKMCRGCTSWGGAPPPPPPASPEVVSARHHAGLLQQGQLPHPAGRILGIAIRQALTARQVHKVHLHRQGQGSPCKARRGRGRAPAQAQARARGAAGQQSWGRDSGRCQPYTLLHGTHRLLGLQEGNGAASMQLQL